MKLLGKSREDIPLKPHFSRLSLDCLTFDVKLFWDSISLGLPLQHKKFRECVHSLGDRVGL